MLPPRVYCLTGLVCIFLNEGVVVPEQRIGEFRTYKVRVVAEIHSRFTHILTGKDITSKSEGTVSGFCFTRYIPFLIWMYVPRIAACFLTIYGRIREKNINQHAFPLQVPHQSWTGNFDCFMYRIERACCLIWESAWPGFLTLQSRCPRCHGSSRKCWIRPMKVSILLECVLMCNLFWCLTPREDILNLLARFGVNTKYVEASGAVSLGQVVDEDTKALLSSNPIHQYELGEVSNRHMYTRIIYIAVNLSVCSLREYDIFLTACGMGGRDRDPPIRQGSHIVPCAYVCTCACSVLAVFLECRAAE